MGLEGSSFSDFSLKKAKSFGFSRGYELSETRRVSKKGDLQYG